MSKSLTVKSPVEVTLPSSAERGQESVGREQREVDVSVIIPTRNRSDLLLDVLESLEQQTLDRGHYEVVVIDDGSTDDTPEQVERFSEQSRMRLRYHRLDEGRGPAYGRNVGVGLAKGETLAFTDSDCRVDQHWLERGLEALADGAGFATGSVLHKPEQRVRFFSGVNPTVEEEHPTYPTCNAFYRRDLYEQMQGMDESLCFTTFLNRATECADVDLAWRIREAGHGHVFDPNLVVYHEVGVKKPWQWVIDPFRLFVVPILVRKHPELRRELLYARMFFGGENVLVYLTVLGMVLGVVVHPLALLLAGPYPIWLGWVLRENLTLRDCSKLVVQIPLLMVRRAVACAGLVYGSIRFRSVVL